MILLIQTRTAVGFPCNTMNRRHLLKTLALSALGTAPFLATRARGEVPAEEPPKGQRRIGVGQTLRYDEGLAVTFLAVLRDKRCPINASCLTAGDAEVLLRVKAGNQKPKILSLRTDGKKDHLVVPAEKFPDGVAGIPKSYVIRIAELNPLPYAGKKTRQSDYRMKLAISVAV